MELVKRPTEVIVRLGKEKFIGKTTAKTMRGWIQGRISTFSKKGNAEMEFIFREILNAYNHYHPEKQIEVKVDQWKSNSSFNIIDKVDKIIIVNYQRPTKEEEPKR